MRLSLREAFSALLHLRHAPLRGFPFTGENGFFFLTLFDGRLEIPKGSFL